MGFPGASSGKEPACHCRRCKVIRVQSLGREDPLEEEMATHSSILAWRIPWTGEPGGLQSTESQRAGHNRSNSTRNTILAYILHQDTSSSAHNTVYFKKTLFVPLSTRISGGCGWSCTTGERRQSGPHFCYLPPLQR